MRGAPVEAILGLVGQQTPDIETEQDSESVFYREAGSGPGVVCLHANASSSVQWRPLVETLSDRFRVFAPDLLGAGNSPPWPTDRKAALGDEVSLLAPVLERAGIRFSIVGHSYGGSVALMAALSYPVAAMVLYEPTLFAVLDQESPEQEGFREINTVVDDSVSFLGAGDRHAAASRFIDYWAGPGAFAKIPDDRKPAVSDSIVNIEEWRHALCNEPTPVGVFAALDIPILYLLGGRSPLSSREVARVLTAVLPQVEVVEFPDLGHMAPVTQPGVVNPLIEQFLADHAL
jgi:pimeloyl-ACP methyl ester carboxylesterase